jgi:hypothetical protein
MSKIFEILMKTCTLNYILNNYCVINNCYVSQIVYVLDQVEEMIRFIFIIMGALMTLMIACYSSQRLMDESQNVFYRA